MISFFAFVHVQTDETWKFWVQFVFYNCYCYISLYLAIRGSNWDLRMSSLKLMAPLFAVLDCSTYERIIPHHIADVCHYPESILKCLKSGSFTVSITGEKLHAVALDYVH